MRKTVKIEWLKEKANKFLADSEDDMIAERRGVAALLESALHETGTYSGFQFLASEWNDEGTELIPEQYRDESRRRYY